MTAPPEQYMVEVPRISFIAGTPLFIRLSDIYAVPGVDMFEVTCITDYYCMLALKWERTNPPADPGEPPLEGLVEDSGPVTNHRLIVPAGAIAQQPRQQMPQEVRYEIRLSESDTSVDAQGERRELRPYIGTLKLRQTPWNFVPVRFYNYGDTPPPPPGGDEGDWNTYAWAQYNPNGLPFERAPLAFCDLDGTNGTETFPAVRVLSRAPAVTGNNLAVALQAPVPLMAQGVSTTSDLYQTAVLDVFVSGVLRERFCWRVPCSGTLEAVESVIRATADSQLIRCARLIINPGSTPGFEGQPGTFMGANYWLVTKAQTPLVVPSAT